MLDFTRVQNGEITVNEPCAGLTLAELRRLADEIESAMLDLIAGSFHDDSHLGQIAELVRQARAARSSAWSPVSC